jgi:hypothetical protein
MNERALAAAAASALLTQNLLFTLRRKGVLSEADLTTIFDAALSAIEGGPPTDFQATLRQYLQDVLDQMPKA